MVGITLDYYFYQLSYLSLKSKNVVKFCVHISPIFSCPVTYYDTYLRSERMASHGSVVCPPYEVVKMDNRSGVLFSECWLSCSFLLQVSTDPHDNA